MRDFAQFKTLSQGFLSKLSKSSTCLSVAHSHNNLETRRQFATICNNHLLSILLQDLPFRRGETLIIISSSKDPNWYKARRLDGLEGMIPYNYVQKKQNSGGSSGGAPAVPPSRPHHSHPPADPNTHHQPKLAVKIQQMP